MITYLQASTMTCYLQAMTYSYLRCNHYLTTGEYDDLLPTSDDLLTYAVTTTSPQASTMTYLRA